MSIHFDFVDVIKKILLFFSVINFVSAADPLIDLPSGKKKVKAHHCMACHGKDGFRIAYPKIYSVPKVQSQEAASLKKALEAYANGDRTHPAMAGIARSLTEQDREDIAAYLSLLAHKPSPDVGQKLPEQKKHSFSKAEIELNIPTIIQTCISCHGADFKTPATPGTPKIAGQHQDYLFASMLAYKKEAPHILKRSDPIMSAQIESLSEEQILTLAKYVANLPGDLR